MLGSVAVHLRYALIIVLVVVVIILLSKWTGTGGGSTAFIVKGGDGDKRGSAGSRLNTNNSESVQQLIKESREWAAETDKHDISPIGQLVNATYALAYAQASQVVAPAAEIKKMTGVEVEPLVASMKAKQTESVQFLAHNFPSIL